VSSTITRRDCRQDQDASEGPPPFRIACWPLDRANPYQSLFYQALSAHNVSVTYPESIDDEWLAHTTPNMDAIHIHWPEALWRVRGNSFLGRLRGAVGVWRFLRKARKQGIKLIWTVHNLCAHEGVDCVDHLGYYALHRNSDLLICHDQHVADSVEARCPARSTVVVMRHGNYEGCFPQPANRSDTLRKLELNPAVLTFCCVGQMRHYKGFDLALAAAGATKLPMQLIVAGNPHPELDIESMRRAVAKLPGARLIERFLTPQDFADLVAASDGVLLPYRNISGSGALLAALTLKRPVIATNLPYFSTTLAIEPDAGVLFENGRVESLVKAFDRFVELPLTHRQEASRRLAEQHAWPSTIAPVVQAISTWRQRN